MTQSEKDTLQMLIVRLEAMLGERPDYGYGGTTLTDEQSPFVRSWILPQLQAVAADRSERTLMQKGTINHAKKDWTHYAQFYRDKQKALKPPTETQAGAGNEATGEDC